MTREEYERFLEWVHSDKYKEFVDEFIKQDKEQRERVLSSGCSYLRTIDLSLEKFQATKTSDKWIPCSERLPNDTAIHEVTAQFKNGKIYTEFAYYDESREEWWKFDDDGIVNVIAWKERSEPYKGDE